MFTNGNGERKVWKVCLIKRRGFQYMKYLRTTVRQPSFAIRIKQTFTGIKREQELSNTETYI